MRYAVMPAAILGARRCSNRPRSKSVASRLRGYFIDADPGLFKGVSHGFGIRVNKNNHSLKLIYKGQYLPLICLKNMSEESKMPPCKSVGCPRGGLREVFNLHADNVKAPQHPPRMSRSSFVRPFPDLRAMERITAKGTSKEINNWYPAR